LLPSGGGDVACTGVLKSVVETTSTAGAQRIETYSVQSAENWFEDAGTGQLVNEAGRVNLESVFGQTVNTGVEYHVFLTPDGDCRGFYVSTKTASGYVASDSVMCVPPSPGCSAARGCSTQLSGAGR
jgi:hypothetical protein